VAGRFAHCSDYTFTGTVGARGLNCGGGSAVPRSDSRFVIYIGLYGNRGENPLAPLPLPRQRGAPIGNNNNPGGVGPKGKTWKKPKCKECNKSGNRYAGPFNSDQLHGKCMAVFEKKQKPKTRAMVDSRKPVACAWVWHLAWLGQMGGMTGQPRT
jgi:hypothetical protein